MEAIRGADLEAKLLRRGPGGSQLARVSLPNTCLDRASIQERMLFSGALPRDLYTLAYVVECPTSGREFRFMTEYMNGYMAISAPGDCVDALIPAGYSNGTVTIPSIDFHRMLDRYFPEGREALTDGAALLVAPAEQARLRMLLESVDQLLADPDAPLMDMEVRFRLEQMLQVAYFDAMRSGIENLVPRPKMRVECRYKKLRQVREFVAEHVNQPIHLDDLCESSGLSPRGLENLFNDLLGIGVICFLRTQRLNGARRALQDAASAPGAVKRIAYDWSFWHMGHFSREYRNLFGESPSQTLSGSLERV